MKKRLMAAVFTLASTLLMAEEGMWQPHQLPSIKKELKAAGLQLSPDTLTDLTTFPMGAIVSLGDCSATFLSPHGLVATNHHCAFGSIQFNSTAENNIIEKGFLAKKFSQELKAAPGSRIYITEHVSDVTQKVIGGLLADTKGIDRYRSIEKNIKKLVSECESELGYHCDVSSFHGGLSYFLIKQLEIKDVRLVYAPPKSIGDYGGEIDNWTWPRHTGDFAFYRAYVSKDGKPVGYSENNVPYQPKHFLKVNANGVKRGDFVMVAGYPGITHRYSTSAEVKNEFEVYSPTVRKIFDGYFEIIKENAPEGSDASVKYASTLKSLHNDDKNLAGKISSYEKDNILQRKQSFESEFTEWLNNNKAMHEKYSDAINSLNTVILELQKNEVKRLKTFSIMKRDVLILTAAELYRLAIEKQKPDTERESGYQEQDMSSFAEGLKGLNQRWDERVAKRLFQFFVTEYSMLPLDQRMKSFDQFMGISENFDQATVAKKIDHMFANTKLTDEKVRLMWMNKSVDEFKQSDDPFIQLAVATYKENHQREQKNKEIKAEIQKFRPKYMQAVMDYYRHSNKPIYADANASLRVSFGTVKGYSPKDGLYSLPFTTLEGLLAKHTGKSPFNSPSKQNQLIREKSYGKYYNKDINSVQVNYLSTVDITGGNSGSSTLNNKAEFVGLAFDLNYESMIGDWDYDPKLKRGIHVSSAYMLWVMEYIDGADNLLKEMTIID